MSRGRLSRPDSARSTCLRCGARFCPRLAGSLAVRLHVLALGRAGTLAGIVLHAGCFSRAWLARTGSASRCAGKRAPPISPLALEAVTRIDALLDIEREINAATAERLAVRRERSAPLVAELEDRMRTERVGLSRHAAVAKTMDCMLKRWDGFARFLDDGRICLTNNAAELALRPLCPGRKSS